MAQVYEITSSDLAKKTETKEGNEIIGERLEINNEKPFIGDDYLEIQYRKTSDNKDEKIHFWIESGIGGFENSESKPYQLLPLAKTTNMEMTVFVDGRILDDAEEPQDKN